MKDAVRGQYKLEFKQQAVRLVRGGESVSSVAQSLGIPRRALHNWVKADTAERLRDVAGKTISTGQMEIARLKAELASTRTERDILKKRRRILRGSRGEILLYRATSQSLAGGGAMSRAECQRQRLSSISRASNGRRWFPSGRPPDGVHSVAGSHQGDFQ